METKDVIKLFLESSIFFGSLMFYFKTKQARQNDINLLEFTNKAILMTPKILINILEAKLKNLISENFQDFYQDDLSSTFTGFVQGKIISEAPLKNLFKKKDNLVFRKMIIEPIYSNSSLSNFKDKIIKKKISENFQIIDPNYNEKINIIMNPKLDINPSLNQIGISTNFQQKNYLISLTSKIIMIFNIIFSLFRIQPFIKGWRIGSKTTLFGLEVGRKILTYGKFFYDKKNKLLTIEKPYFILKNKSQLINLQKEKILRWKKLNYISIIIMISSLIMIFRRTIFLYNKIKIWFSKFLKEFKMNKLKGLSTLLIDGFLCSKCGTNPKNIIFVPCYHMAYCKSCFDKHNFLKCPTCNKEIKDLVKIFIV